MATSPSPASPQLPQEATGMRSLSLAQFALYRQIVARKHGIAVWLPDSPATMTGPELEQWVTFLKDAAHLPPG